jgi:hypothetical protein
LIEQIEVPGFKNERSRTEEQAGRLADQTPVRIEEIRARRKRKPSFVNLRDLSG